MKRALLAITAVLLTGGAMAGSRRQGSELLPEELARKYVEAYNAHDAKAVMELFTEDMTLTAPDLSVVKGRAGNEKYYKAWFNSVPDVKSRTLTLTTDGERFVLECVETGTYTRRMPTAGSPPARRQKLNYPYVMVGKCRGGRIADVRIYENDLVIERQLGVRQ